MVAQAYRSGEHGQEARTFDAHEPNRQTISNCAVTGKRTRAGHLWRLPILPSTKMGWPDLFGAREFYVEGPGERTCSMLSIARFALPRASSISPSNMMTESSGINDGPVLEFDSIITPQQAEVQLQFQFNNAVAHSSIECCGRMVDTGLKAGRFIPFQWYNYNSITGLNSVAKRYSFLAVTCAATSTAINTTLPARFRLQRSSRTG